MMEGPALCGGLFCAKNACISAQAREQYISAAFADIAQRLGVDLFRQTPAVLLEQLAVMSALKNHDTAGLLKSMINSFLIAYVTPETHDQIWRGLKRSVRRSLPNMPQGSQGTEAGA